MSPTVLFTATAIPGGMIHIDWSASSDITYSSSTVIQLRITDTLANEASQVSSINIHNIPMVNTAAVNSPPVYATSYILSTGLILGTTYLLQLAIDGAFSSSNLVKVQDVPQKPSLSVISRDQSLALSVSGLTFNSASDGFSEITDIEISYAEGTTLNTIIKSKNDWLNLGENIYNTFVGFPLAGTPLINGTKYEVAVRLKNLIGYSPISDTKIGTPKDTPNKVAEPLVLSDVTYLNYSSSDITQAKGWVYLFAQRSGDYQNLNAKDAVLNSPTYGQNIGPLRITKMNIKRYEMMANMVDDKTKSPNPDGTYPKIQSATNPWVLNPNVNPVLITQPLNDTDAADPLLVTTSFPSGPNNTTISYDYKFLDNSTIIGKVYKYTVFYTNANGDGEESPQSNLVSSLDQPNAPTLTRIMGDKKMVATFTDYGSLNGSSQPSSNRFKYVKKEDSGNWSQSFEFDPEYIQTLGVAPNTSPNPNYNKYTFLGDTNGNTLSVRIYRKGLDSFAPPFIGSSNTYFSPYTELTGLMRTIPKPPYSIGVYSIDSNYIPLTKTVNGTSVAAVSIEFHPFNNSNISSNLGGYDKQVGFEPTTMLRYVAYKNSTMNGELTPIYSSPLAGITTSTTFSFLASSPLNTSPAHYVRTEVFDIETGLWVTSIDSTPPQLGASLSYVDAPATLDIIRETGSSASAQNISVKFPLNPTISGTISGSNPSNVYYLINLVNIDTGVSLTPITVNYNVTTGGNTTVSNGFITQKFNGLNSESAYLAYVVPYIFYSAYNIAVEGQATSYRYENIQIRRNYIHRTFIAAAQPSAPTNFQVRPQDAEALVDFDAPTSLNGTTLARYDLYAIRQDPNDVAPTLAYPAFPTNQVAVTSVVSPQEIYVKKVWNSRLSGVDGGTPLVNIINNTELYSFALAAIGVVGGRATTLGLSSYVDSVSGGSVGANVTVSYSSSLPLEYVQGLKTTPLINFTAYAATDSPTGLSTTSDANSITVTFVKDPNADEVLIKSNGEDVFNTSKFSTSYAQLNGPNLGKIDIQAGTTVGLNSNGTMNTNGIWVTPGYSSGLFSLQQAPFTTTNATDVQKFFTVTNVGSTVYYNVKIAVTTGAAQNLEVFYGRNISSVNTTSYSKAATTSASAATPPSVITNPSFSVNVNQITAFWQTPNTIGGAGSVAFTGAAQNSGLLYQVTLYTLAGYSNNGTKVSLQTISGLSGLSYTFNGLLNYNSTNSDNTSYVIGVVAYYNQQNDSSKPSKSNEILVNYLNSGQVIGIRASVPPQAVVPSVVSTDTANGNSVIIGLSIPSDTNYPLDRVDIYDGATIIKTVSTGLSNGTIVQIPLSKATNSAGNSNFLNGRAIPLRFAFTPNYKYAQNYSDATLNIYPRKLISSSDMIVTNPSADLKTYLLAVTTHGSSTSGLVAIGKTSSGSLQVVQQSIAGANWSPTTGGAANANDAAGLTQSATFAFPVPVTDVMTILSHQDGNATKVTPSNSSAFGVTVNN